MSSSTARGVSIAIHERLPIHSLEHVADPNGRYLFLKFRLQNKLYTIANLYIQNHYQTTAVSWFLHLLADFAEGTTLVGGDFNLVLEPKLDASSQQSNISYSRLRTLRKQLFDHQLLDLWWTLYPKNCNYTSPRSITHSSRLDYFFVGPQVLEWSPCLDIGSFIWSDHLPLFLTIHPPQTSRPYWSRRLNETPMSDSLLSPGNCGSN